MKPDSRLFVLSFMKKADSQVIHMIWNTEAWTSVQTINVTQEALKKWVTAVYYYMENVPPDSTTKIPVDVTFSFKYIAIHKTIWDHITSGFGSFAKGLDNQTYVMAAVPFIINYFAS